MLDIPLDLISSVSVGCTIIGNELMHNEGVTLSQFAAMDADKVFRFLQDVDSNRITLAKDFNWLALSEIATSNALIQPNGKNKAKPDLKWVGIAIVLYQKLSIINPDNEESLTLSEMNLRATVIIRSKVTTSTEDILDSSIIENWYLSTLPLSFAEAKESIQYWKKDIKLARVLKKIKLRLSIIKRLYDSQSVQINSELTGWLELYPELP